MKTVVLLSGGVDSTVLLYRTTGEVIALTVDYGQRQREQELDAARTICEARGVRLIAWDIPDLQRLLPDVPDGHPADVVMTAMIVPNRNTVLLALATAVEVDERADVIAFAAHRGDAAIYPDCRPAFVDAFREVVRLGTDRPLHVAAPFLHATKADIVREGRAINVPFALTYSCYRGAPTHCGTCGACAGRREAFRLAGVPDPTGYDVA
jgi:7-cyano-7-deazaguanine synthase